MTHQQPFGIAGSVRAEIARQQKTVKGIALDLGWSRRTLHRRLSGDTEFSAAELDALARHLGVPIAALLEPAA